MRYALFICLIFVALALPSMAQAPAPSAISVGPNGTILTLGESKETTFASLRKNYEVANSSRKNEYYAQVRGSAGDIVAIVEFEDDKLSSVTRP